MALRLFISIYMCHMAAMIYKQIQSAYRYSSPNTGYRKPIDYINTLRPSDQYMPLAWPAPSHCLYQCLLIGSSGTKFSEILVEIHAFVFTKMQLKMLSGKWRPFCLGLIELNVMASKCYLVQIIRSGIYSTDWWNWQIKWMKSVTMGSFQYKNQVKSFAYL